MPVRKKLTRLDCFLAALEQLVPRALLKAQVAPLYAATAGKRGAGNWAAAHAADVCGAAVLWLIR